MALNCIPPGKEVKERFLLAPPPPPPNAKEKKFTVTGR